MYIDINYKSIFKLENFEQEVSADTNNTRGMVVVAQKEGALLADISGVQVLVSQS